MHSFLSILIWAIPVVIVAGLAWFAWDMRSILKSLQHKNQFAIDGDWKKIEKYFERAARTRRPFVWLHRKYFLPGNLETQHEVMKGS